MEKWKLALWSPCHQSRHTSHLLFLLDLRTIPYLEHALGALSPLLCMRATTRITCDRQEARPHINHKGKPSPRDFSPRTKCLVSLVFRKNFPIVTLQIPTSVSAIAQSCSLISWFSTHFSWRHTQRLWHASVNRYPLPRPVCLLAKTLQRPSVLDRTLPIIPSSPGLPLLLLNGTHSPEIPQKGYMGSCMH